MPYVRNELIQEITDQIRKAGGRFSDWFVGTARDWHDPVLDTHQSGEIEDGFICREAYTPGGARAVRDYFATQCGTAPGNVEDSQDGKLVYAYRK